jgi:hypothetical protein
MRLGSALTSIHLNPRCTFRTRFRFSTSSEPLDAPRDLKKILVLFGTARYVVGFYERIR